MTPIQTVVTVLQGLVALFTILALFCRPLRRAIFGAIEESKAEREAVMCLLRDAIVKIYYKNIGTCEIRSYEFENVAMLYKAYKRLGGNSFVDKIWNEIQEWTVVR